MRNLTAPRAPKAEASECSDPNRPKHKTHIVQESSFSHIITGARNVPKIRVPKLKGAAKLFIPRKIENAQTTVLMRSPNAKIDLTRKDSAEPALGTPEGAESNLHSNTEVQAPSKPTVA